MIFNEKQPITGVGIMIFKEDKVLLGKRKSSHGAGEYSFPGGKLDYLESFEQCARREIKEECGIKIRDIRFQFLANLLEYEPKHFTHIGLIADWESGELMVLEPDKCESWNWYDLNRLPIPLFFAVKMAFESLKTKKNYYDISLDKKS